MDAEKELKISISQALNGALRKEALWPYAAIMWDSMKKSLTVVSYLQHLHNTHSNSLENYIFSIAGKCHLESREA